MQGKIRVLTITISAELEIEVRNKARAEGLSVEAYVERLIREDEEWVEQSEEPLDDRDPEFVDIRAAVTEGLEQAERGESRPAEQVFAELRAKYGISG
jgi:predicted transcriptional regulator